MPKRYTPNDKWARKAAEEGYRARSVYKLMELDEKFRLLKQGMTVLDLGAAPGSWSQYAAERVLPNGKVIAVDLQEIEPIEGVDILCGDIADLSDLEPCDIILSDLAPKTTGIKDVDQWKSIELSQMVLRIADSVLTPNGSVVMKVFRGADFDEFLRECKAVYKHVKTCNVQASRDRSKEIYVVAKQKVSNYTSTHD